MLGTKRKPITTAIKKLVWKKTGGRCHFCGVRLMFSAKQGKRGRWHVDHIFQKKYGGVCDISNYLPICRDCNRLRWFWNSKKIRRIFRYGMLAVQEVKRNTEMGKHLRHAYEKRRAYNFTKRELH